MTRRRGGEKREGKMQGRDWGGGATGGGARSRGKEKDKGEGRKG